MVLSKTLIHIMCSFTLTFTLVSCVAAHQKYRQQTHHSNRKESVAILDEGRMSKHGGSRIGCRSEISIIYPSHAVLRSFMRPIAGCSLKQMKTQTIYMTKVVDWLTIPAEAHIRIGECIKREKEKRNLSSCQKLSSQILDEADVPKKRKQESTFPFSHILHFLLDVYQVLLFEFQICQLSI